MADLQVLCVNKQPRDDRHESIQRLGGANWRYSLQEVVSYINRGTHTFYTMSNGKRANLEVRASPYGNAYVQTRADGQFNNNLLSLPECY